MRAFHDGRDQPAPRRELLDQWRRDIRAGCRDADPIVRGVVGVTEAPVALKEDHFGVAGPAQVLPGERERRGVDLDCHDETLGTDDLLREGGAVARPHANLEEPVPLLQAERLVEQRIAMRARDRGPLAWEREGDLFVRMVPVASRDEVFASYGEHRPAKPFGAEKSAPRKLRDLCLPLASQVLVALDRSARRRNKPSAHFLTRLIERDSKSHREPLSAASALPRSTHPHARGGAHNPGRRRTLPWVSAHPLVVAARAIGVQDARVLDAVAAVSRAAYVPHARVGEADLDLPIPIGSDQVTTQPSLVAAMVEALALRGGERVLEVGTGLGYQAAILGRLAREVWTIERLPKFAAAAAANLAAEGVYNVYVREGDGSDGLAAHSPFDTIVVAAAHPHVPGPLVAQLVPGGRLVQPIGPSGSEEVTLFRRARDRLVRVRVVTGAHFVPLYGRHGFPPPARPGR
jgi:protein-L-isoaspartate(D-aspartate) O-methyltransferase